MVVPSLNHGLKFHLIGVTMRFVRFHRFRLHVRRFYSGNTGSERTHAFEKCRTVFHCGARPWLLLLAVHATLEPYEETVAFVQVRPKLLNLVVARPRLVHLLTSFVKSAHLQPHFMIDGSMRE